MLSRIENLTVTAIAVMVGVLLIFVIYSFSQVSNGHDRILEVVQSSAARLEALESNKAKATSKRFTSDDGEALMRCLRIPNQTPAREACLQAVEMQIAERAAK